MDVAWSASSGTCPSAAEETVTLRRAIGHMPPLDALYRRRVGDPLHAVPEWSRMQYDAMAHTPEGKSALGNSKCGACGKVAPRYAIRCACGAPLWVPSVTFEGWVCQCGEPCRAHEESCPSGHARSGPMRRVTRRVRGFGTSYRRLRWDRPCNTLTTNSGDPSDVKGHPEEHRCLSV